MNKFKVIVLCIVLGVAVGLLAGCSEPAPLKGSTLGYKIICLDDVAYWESPDHALAPKYSVGYDMPDTCS